MKEPNKEDLQRFTRGEPYDRKTVNRRTFLSFLTLGIGGAAGFFGWKWLYNNPLEKPGVTGQTRKALRTVLNANEQVFNKTLAGDHLAKTYPVSAAAKTPRVNGDIGLNAKGIHNWQLMVPVSIDQTLSLTEIELSNMPKTDIVFDFKCVEGWEEIQHWAGVRFSDFLKALDLNACKQYKYVGLKTPDEKYYVGVDMASMLHPQTILAYEMNGRPITPEHGAPLRLIIPVKYGIKNLKQIGTVFFSNERPPDYWAERGYDYYAGL